MSDDNLDANTDEAEKNANKRKPITPHINDIVSGRGSGSNRHEGNLYFRKLIRENKDLYLSRPKNEKMLVARDIFHTIETLDPPGRFLQKNPETGSWFEIGKERALEKISQALREKNSKQPSNLQPGHFGLGFPPQLQGHEQERLNLPQAQFATGINRMTSHARQGFGVATGQSIGGYDMAGNEIMTRVPANSYVSDGSMIERRIAELREARQQMMRGGAGPPNDLINQAQYQNVFLSSLDSGRNNLNLRGMDPSFDGSLHSTSNFVNRQASWLQESQPLPSLPEIPQNCFANPPSRLFGDQDANARLSLLENERAHFAAAARQNEYLNSLSSTQGFASPQGLSSAPIYGNSLMNSNIARSNLQNQLRSNQNPLLATERQLELNNLITQRQQLAQNRQEFSSLANNQFEEKPQEVKIKRKRKRKNIQSSKESMSESRKGKISRSDLSLSSRSSLASSLGPSSSQDKDAALHDANNKANQQMGTKGQQHGSNNTVNEPKMPPLKTSRGKDNSPVSKNSSTGGRKSRSDGGESREQSPSVGLEALSKAASLMRR